MWMYVYVGAEEHCSSSLPHSLTFRNSECIESCAWVNGLFCSAVLIQDAQNGLGLFYFLKSLETRISPDIYLKILILLFCQGFLGHHQNPQTLPCHVSALEKQQVYLTGLCSRGWYQLKTYEMNFPNLSCLLKRTVSYLLFQPVVILDDTCHYHVGTLHVESDFSSGFILEIKINLTLFEI